ncbi:MAG: hypothetical protein PVJ25_04120 [Desulfuromonadales bacterium]|jgi:hypothetical protein
MHTIWSLIQSVPVWVLIILCLTLGLAPFVPEPHIWEKLKMLAAGSLTRPIDIFDLLLHALPFALLALRLVATYFQK